MRIVAMSDVHSMINQIPLKNIPEGDLLIISGDLTNMGETKEIIEFIQDIRNIRKAIGFSEVVCVAGNHDFGFQDAPGIVRNLIGDAFTYLEDEEFVFQSKRIYGSPWTPFFYDWAYNLDALDEKNDYQHARRVWGKIPDDTNILVTHGPARGILDYVERSKLHVGCPILLERIKELKKLQLFIHGHIHGARGQKTINKVKFVNASTCNEKYEPINPPLVINIK